jgi:hypothetical protein
MSCDNRAYRKKASKPCIARGSRLTAFSHVALPHVELTLILRLSARVPAGRASSESAQMLEEQKMQELARQARDTQLV